MSASASHLMCSSGVNKQVDSVDSVVKYLNWCSELQKEKKKHFFINRHLCTHLVTLVTFLQGGINECKVS